MKSIYIPTNVAGKITLKSGNRNQFYTHFNHMQCRQFQKSETVRGHYETVHTHTHTHTHTQYTRL